MIEFIGLFCPALVTVYIRHKRKPDSNWRFPEGLIEYGITVMLNVLFAEAVIGIILGHASSTVDNLNYYSYFIKYTIIALSIAIIHPFIEEILKKYVSAKITIKDHKK